MPWWSWILIWIALIAVSLLFYVLLGIRLFRQFMATMRDLGAAGERFGAPLADLTDPAPDFGRETESPEQAQRPLPGSAVFASPMQMRHDYLTSKSSRREERRRRRVQRKADRGQPQALRDIEFS
jgi:hypothetical protein